MMDRPPILWGESDVSVTSQEPLLAFVRSALFLEGTRRRLIPPPSDVLIPASALTLSQMDGLTRIVGDGNVGTGHVERVRHACGRGYRDILRYCSRKLDRAPDAVVYPADVAQVQAILDWCCEQRVGLVPFGGGTNVVGALDPPTPAIAMRLSKLNRILEINPTSGTVTVEPGILGPALEQALNAQGFTLGHFPESFEYSTVGGWIATRSTGTQSSLCGTIQDIVFSLHVLTPAGMVRTSGCPVEASGPDLNHLFCGSQGALGVIVQATLRIRRLPECRFFTSGIFRTFTQGIDALRELLQEGLPPAAVRLFDQDETQVVQAMGGSGAYAARRTRRWLQTLSLRAKGLRPDHYCLLLLAFEGHQAFAQQRTQHATRIMAIHEGVPFGPKPAEKWYATRLQLPYLRDAIVQEGVLVDMVETAATWTRLPGLYQEMSHSMRRALSRVSSNHMLLGKVSHAYPQGASLCLTFLAKAKPGEELMQWQTIRSAAVRAIQRSHAALNHPHGAGHSMAEDFRKRVPPVQRRILKSIKRRADPDGIMNPGKWPV
jgi:alkyldihydroxyacetonephosphate synthase